jgi:hypothetical protein
MDHIGVGFGRQGMADLCAGQRRCDSRGTPLPDGHAGAVPGDPVVCVVGALAFALSHVYTMLTPSMGRCGSR